MKTVAIEVQFVPNTPHIRLLCVRLENGVEILMGLPLLPRRNDAVFGEAIKIWGVMLRSALGPDVAESVMKDILSRVEEQGGRIEDMESGVAS